MTKLTLAAVGDISFCRLPEQLFRADAGYDFFAGVRDDLARADIRFGNLESVMVPADFPLDETRGCPLQSRDDLIRTLAPLKFDVLHTASNHVLDCGWRGLLNTLDKVRSIGAQPLGSGRDQNEARALRIVEKNGVKVGFMGALQAGDWTLEGGGGRVAYWKEENLLADIRKYRPLVDVLVVSMHGDLEFLAAPSLPRLRLFRKVAEAGADLILGHHPHVPQGVEKWGSCLIDYSLGNFVFDLHGYLISHSPDVDRSHIFFVEIEDSRIVSWHRKYFRIDMESCRPLPLDGDAAAREDADYRMRDALLADPDRLRALWYESCRRRLAAVLRRIREEKTITPEQFLKKYCHALFGDMSHEWLDGAYELALLEYRKHAEGDYEFKYPFADLLED